MQTLQIISARLNLPNLQKKNECNINTKAVIAFKVSSKPESSIETFSSFNLLRNVTKSLPKTSLRIKTVDNDFSR